MYSVKFSLDTNVDDVLGHMLCITDPACPEYLYAWRVWSHRCIFNQRTAHNCLGAAADREWEEHLIIAALIAICGR